MSLYTIRWTFTESTTYRMTVDAARLAELTGRTVAEIEACDTGTAILDLDEGLSDNLAESEDGSSGESPDEESYTNEREVDSIAILTTDS